MAPLLYPPVAVKFEPIGDVDGLKPWEIVLTEGMKITVGRVKSNSSKHSVHHDLSLSNTVVSRHHAMFTYERTNEPLSSKVMSSSPDYMYSSS
jgi:hypothetical protein